MPELQQFDPASIEAMVKNALRGSSPEDYIDRLLNARRRNQDLQPAAKAISDQFIKDNNQTDINLGEYELVDEYGATKCYQVTEQNSKVVFDLTFYFYGGIISGWSVEPGEAS